MKLRYSSIIILLLAFVILIDTRFLYMCNINRFSIVVVSFIAWGVYLVCNSKNKIVPLPILKYVRIICFSTVFSYLILFVYTCIEFPNQTIEATIKGENHYYCLLLIILVFPILYCVSMCRGNEKIWKLLNIFAFVIYVLEIMQAYIYNTRGIIFLSSFFVGNSSIERMGSIRLLMHWTGNVMIIYNFYMYYNYDKYENSNRRKRFVYGMMTLMGMYSLIIISRSRMSTLEVLLCVFLVVVFDKSRNIISFFKKNVLFVAAGAFGILYDVLGKVMNSISLTGEYAYSSKARIYAYGYFWNYFLQHPFLGFGLANQMYYPQIVHGNGMAYVDDVGLVGHMASMGCLTFIVYIVPLVRGIYISYRIRDSKVVLNKELYIVMTIFMIATTPIHLVLDSERILFWPFYIAMMEYVFWVSKKSDYCHTV